MASLSVGAYQHLRMPLELCIPFAIGKKDDYTGPGPKGEI